MEAQEILLECLTAEELALVGRLENVDEALYRTYAKDNPPGQILAEAKELQRLLDQALQRAVSSLMADLLSILEKPTATQEEQQAAIRRIVEIGDEMEAMRMAYCPDEFPSPPLAGAKLATGGIGMQNSRIRATVNSAMARLRALWRAFAFQNEQDEVIARSGAAAQRAVQFNEANGLANPPEHSSGQN